MRLGLVVEGINDRYFFEGQKNWFQQHNHEIVTIVPTGGKAKLIKDAPKHMRVLRIKGCEKIIYFIDQNAAPCPPSVASRFDQIRLEQDVLICVMARELEGWLLADSEGITRITGKDYRNHTDDVTNAKDITKDLLRKRPADVIPDIEIIAKMRPVFSFERAQLRNATIRRFLSKIT